MIYITGDCHTEWNRFSTKNFPEQKEWFFGHYHDNRNLKGKYVLLYEQIIRIL